jgi:polysaccharide chain length determinant protein (PEP-CTERM system associated)
MLPGKKLTVSEILTMVRRRALLLIIPPIVTLFLALVYSATLKNVYQSDVLISIVPQRVPPNFVQTTVTLRTEDRLDAITTQIKTRTVLERLILELNLYPEERKRFPMEDVVAVMRNNFEIELEEPRRSPQGPLPPHAFHVRFKYADPLTATRVTERLGQLYVDQNARDRDALAESTDQFLETQLAEASQRLIALEHKLEAFREQHGNELPTQAEANLQSMNATQMQIQQLVEALARDRDRKMMLERLYAEAEKEPIPAPPVVLQSQQPSGDVRVTPGATAKQQLEQAREQLAALQVRYKPEHPAVSRQLKAIAELELKAAAEDEARDDRTASVSPAPAPVMSTEQVQRRESLRQWKAEIESLDRQTEFKEKEEARLRTVVDEYRRRVEAVPGIESAWVALTRDYGTQQESYRKLLERSQEAKVAVNLERRQIGEQFRVLDAAKVPQRPISPFRLQINAVGFVVGLVLGLVVAALLEIRDASFRIETDVMETLALQVLAVVPQVDSPSDRARRLRRRVYAWGATAVCCVAAGYVFWTMRLWAHVI